MHPAARCNCGPAAVDYGWIRHGKATPFPRNTAVGSIYIAARLNDRYPESWLADPQHILIAFAPSSPKKTNLITLVFTVVGPLHAPTYQWDSTYLRYPNHIQSLGFSYGFSHGFHCFHLGKMVCPEAPLGRGLSSGRAAADPRGVGAAAGAGARPKLQWWMDFSCFFMDSWMQCS